MTIGAKGLLFTAGPALDVEAMLQAPKGRVPVNVVYTGGLRNARERELVVATLCKDVLSWMTVHPSSDLRLVVYIDEVAGLCPPHPRNPPAKKFLSLLFRQARGWEPGRGVVQEETCGEIKPPGALSERATTAGERPPRGRRRAAAAPGGERATPPADVEEGIGLRVLGLFDDEPGLYGPEEIGSKIVIDGRFLAILLRKLAEHRLLRVEHIDGRDVYWDPMIGFDPRRGAPKRLARFPLRFPLVKATKHARDRLRRRMLVIPNERIVRKDFYYLPLWRVEAEIPAGGRNDGRAPRQFYVHAVTGEVGHAVYGRLTFEEIPRKDAVRLEPLAANSPHDHLPAETVNDAIPVAKVGPSQAQDIVRTTLGAKPTDSEPELVLLPMWRFDVRSNGAGRERTMWMEGTFGSIFDKSP